MFYLIGAGHHGPSGVYSGLSRKVSQRNLRASLSDSNRVSTSPSRTGPLTFRMMERLVSSINSTQTCVHCPCEPVLPSTLVTLASLMGCTRLVSMMAAIRRRGWKSVLDSYHIGPGDQSQIIQFGGKHLYLLSHLACPNPADFMLTLAGWVCWHMPLIPAFQRQRRVDLCEFEDSLVPNMSSRA